MNEDVGKNVVLDFEAWKLTIQSKKAGKARLAFEQELLNEFRYVTSSKRRELLIATAKQFAWLDFLDDENLPPIKPNDKPD